MQEISKAVNHNKTKKNAAKDKDEDGIVDDDGLLKGWLSKRGSDQGSSAITRAFTWKARFFRQSADHMFLAYVLKVPRRNASASEEDPKFFAEILLNNHILMLLLFTAFFSGCIRKA